jgi:hypothetical protein
MSNLDLFVAQAKDIQEDLARARLENKLSKHQVTIMDHARFQGLMRGNSDPELNTTVKFDTQPVDDDDDDDDDDDAFDSLLFAKVEEGMITNRRPLGSLDYFAKSVVRDFPASNSAAKDLDDATDATTIIDDSTAQIFPRDESFRNLTRSDASWHSSSWLMRISSKNLLDCTRQEEGTSEKKEPQRGSLRVDMTGSCRRIISFRNLQEESKSQTWDDTAGKQKPRRFRSSDGSFRSMSSRTLQELNRGFDSSLFITMNRRDKLGHSQSARSLRVRVGKELGELEFRNNSTLDGAVQEGNAEQEEV